MIRALISQVKGLAAFDDGVRVHFLSATSNDSASENSENANANQKSISEAPDLEYLEVHDIQSLHTHLKLRRNREELLHASIILLDSSASLNLRSLAAELLSKQNNTDDWSWVEGVLCSAPLPSSADLKVAIELCPLHRDFFVRLGASSGQISRLLSDWHELPEFLFHYETRDQTHAKVVRHGAFRNLIMGGASLRNNPFSIALQRCYNSLKGRAAEPTNVFYEHTQPNSHMRIGWEEGAWRIACNASEWPLAEARLATRGANILAHSIASDDVPNQIFQESDLVKFFETWNLIRNQSSLSDAVDLMYSITSTAESAHPNQLQGFGAHRSSKRIYSSSGKASQDTLPESWRGVRPDVLKEMVLEYFEVTSDKSGEDNLGNFSLAVPSIDKSDYGIVSGWQSLMREVRSVLNVSRPAEQREFFDLSARKHSGVNHLTANNTLGDLASSFADVLSVYALDRVFQRKGFMIVISQTAKSVFARKNHYAVLLNPEIQSGHFFDSHVADLIIDLRKRLISDIASGVPTSRCGWVLFEDVTKNTFYSASTIEKRFEDLRSNVNVAGFPSNVLQRESDVVRFNPDYATSTNLDLSS